MKSLVISPRCSLTQISRRLGTCPRRQQLRRRRSARRPAFKASVADVGLRSSPIPRTVDPIPRASDPKTRLRVAVDVDEVLGQFLVELNGFCQERYGMSHNVEDYHVYHFATIWGCSQETSSHIVHEFFESSNFQQLPLVPGAFEALCEMQAWCDLHVVTSRQHVIQDITIEWLSTHYPGIFRSIKFGNHYAREGPTRKKSDLCKEIDADVLIDDNPDYAMDCAASGINVILYNWQNGYPWSRLSEKDDRIREVTCWSDVPQTLRTMFLEQDHEALALI